MFHPLPNPTPPTPPGKMAQSPKSQHTKFSKIRSLSIHESTRIENHTRQKSQRKTCFLIRLEKSRCRLKRFNNNPKPVLPITEPLKKVPVRRVSSSVWTQKSHSHHHPNTSATERTTQKTTKPQHYILPCQRNQSRGI